MYYWCKRQATESLHVAYVEKATRNLNQIVYFTGSAAFGYFLLKDSVWLPWYLGG